MLPSVLSVLYALVTGQPFAATTISIVIMFGYMALYFWLLDYFSESWWYWLIFILGLITPLLLALLYGWLFSFSL